MVAPPFLVSPWVDLTSSMAALVQLLERLLERLLLERLLLERLLLEPLLLIAYAVELLCVATEACTHLESGLGI